LADKITICDQYLALSRKRCKIEPQLLWKANRKPHPSLDIGESNPQFRHSDYNPDRAQKLISLSISRHLSTRNISSKSMHAFLSNLANRQTDIQTKVGKRFYLLLCQRSSSSRMRVINHNWSAMKQRLHPLSVAEISRHLVLSGDRIR